jgi:AcrR family transcriptional regulator
LNGRSKQLRADRRRSEIRRDAMAAIRRLGLRRAGMREIADAAGLSAGNLYYYWKSKEALVADCQEATLDALLEVAARAQAERGSEAQLAELVRGHLRVILSDDGGDVHLDFAGLPPALYRRVVQKRDRYERAVRALVSDGQKRGDLRGGDPKLAAFALLGALNWTARWYHSGGAYTVSDVIDHFVPQLLGGLLRHEPRQAAR